MPVLFSIVTVAGSLKGKSTVGGTASYNNNSLMNIKISSFTATANTSNDITLHIDLKTVSGGIIKVMLWSNLDNVKPLAYYIYAN